MESDERMMKGASDGEPSAREAASGERRRGRRRPLHFLHRCGASVACCLLLASAASSALVLADADDAPVSNARPSLRRRRQRDPHHSDKGLSSSSSSSVHSASSSSSPRRQRRQLKQTANSSDKWCPGEYTGKAPTNKCQGYLSCTDGKPSSAVQACSSGTQFDVKSGTCTWPDSVTCRTGNELLQQLGQGGGAGGKDDDGDGGGKKKPEKPSKFCPERYTGRAPTNKCGGYVQCNSGKEGLSAKCPPNTQFNTMTSLCEYDLDRCEMLVGDSPSDSDYVGVNELDKFCPMDYDGRAPTYQCEGYVDCKAGKAKRAKRCPGSTRFDVMIMACTFSSAGCDALESDEPTPSPLTDAEATQSREDDLVAGCPEGHTGHLALPGCEEYIYCAFGEELQRIKCGAGTLFMQSGGYCNWADSVSCETTKLPTRSPTFKPTYEPTVVPTGVPTEFNIEGDVFYPNFSAGVCLGDGNYPPGVGRQFLFQNAEGCCDKYFPNNMDRCVKASMPTPAPTPSGGKTVYPDYATNSCKSDGKHNAWETNFYFTYEECCEFDWLDTVECLRKAPVIAFYPDYDTDSCKNDGMQSPFESNIFGSLEECCRFEWIDYGLCITGGTRPEVEPPGQGQPPDVEPEIDFGYEFYPDYTNNMCRCDGKQSKYEINIFSTYEACCQFTLIDTESCRERRPFVANKCVDVADAPAGKPTPPASSPSRPSSPSLPAIWYPDMEGGLCRDDGRQPGGVALAATHVTCCKRFMNLHKQDCRDKSEANSVSLAGPDNPCPGLKGKVCGKESKCRWDWDRKDCVRRTTPSPTPDPTPEPTRWPTPKPTRRPTPWPQWSQQQWNPKPTRRPNPAPNMIPQSSPSKPAPAPNNDPCSSNNKKQCLKDPERCQFDVDTYECWSLPTPAPVPPPKQPYYPDFFQGVCFNDGNHLNKGLEPEDLYDNYEDCCRNQWLQYKPCYKHATGKLTLAQIVAKGPNDGGVEEVLGNKGDAGSGNDGNRYYPDYFYNVCRNDGGQSPLETNLFDTMKECCEGVQYIDYGSCMSNAGG